ncbi:MAG: hypothetical protein KDK99_15800 [Verrucomicrobiales bacterium]|nr:hypothetical protein [Verrucomicrobiales bacterium]
MAEQEQDPLNILTNSLGNSAQQLAQGLKDGLAQTQPSENEKIQETLGKILETLQNQNAPAESESQGNVWKKGSIGEKLASERALSPQALGVHQGIGSNVVPPIKIGGHRMG